MHSVFHYYFMRMHLFGYSFLYSFLPSLMHSSIRSFPNLFTQPLANSPGTQVKCHTANLEGSQAAVMQSLDVTAEGALLLPHQTFTLQGDTHATVSPALQHANSWTVANQGCYLC